MKLKDDVLRDALKMAMPVVVPFAVEKILALIPPGSSVDEFLEKNNGIVQKAISGFSFLFLRATDHSEFADAFVAEIASEINKELKRRYDTSGPGTPSTISSATTAKSFSINFLQSTLNIDELKKFIKKIMLLDERQKKSFLALSFADKKSGENLLKTLVGLSSSEFLSWINSMFPAPATKVESNFEKAAKKSLGELKSDGASFFSKKSWLEKYCDSIGVTV